MKNNANIVYFIILPAGKRKKQEEKKEFEKIGILIRVINGKWNLLNKLKNKIKINVGFSIHA